MAGEGRPVPDRGKSCVCAGWFWVPVGCLGIKRPGREADNSSSCSVEVDVWRCSSALLEILVAWCTNELEGKFSFHRCFTFFLALQIIIVIIAVAVIKSKRMGWASQRKVLGVGQCN
jgi:hypothetical protein